MTLLNIKNTVYEDNINNNKYSNKYDNNFHTALTHMNNNVTHATVVQCSTTSHSKSQNSMV